MLILEWLSAAYKTEPKLFSVAYKAFYDLFSDNITPADCLFSLHILEGGLGSVKTLYTDLQATTFFFFFFFLTSNNMSSVHGLHF